MNSDTVYTKTAKGILEIRNKTVKLPRDIGLVFLTVDGKTTVADLVARSGMGEQKVHQALERLVTDGYIRTLSASGTANVEMPEGSVDFTTPVNPIPEIEAAARSRTESDANAPVTQGRSKIEIDLSAEPEAESPAQAESRRRAAAMVVARAAAEVKSHAEAEGRSRALGETKGTPEDSENRAKAGNDAQSRALETKVRQGLEAQLGKLAAASAEPLPAIIEPSTPARPVIDPFEAQQQAARLRQAAEAERREREGEPKFELEPRAQALQARAQAEVRTREEAQARSNAAVDSTKGAATPAANRLPALDIDGGDARRAAPLRPPPAFEPAQAAPAGLARAMAKAAAHAGGEIETTGPEPELEELPAGERASDAHARDGDVFAEQERVQQRLEATEKSREQQRQRQLQEERRRAMILERIERRKAIIRNAAVSAILIVAGVVALLQFTPFNSFIPDAQQKISARLGEPVTIASLRYPLLPTPRLILEGVVIGKSQGVKIDTVTVAASPFALRGNTSVDTVEASGVTIDPDMLATIPVWAATPRTADLRMNRLVLTSAQVKPLKQELGAFNVEAAFAPDGALRDARLKSDKVTLVMVAMQSAVRITLSAQDWRPPIGPALDFSYLDLTAVVDNTQLVVNDLQGRIAGGTLKATIAAKWNGPISMEGDFTMDNVRLQSVMPVFTPYFPTSGLLKASGNYSLQSKSLDGLFAVPRVQATFAVQRGELKEIDLLRTIQASVGTSFRGGHTPFDDLSGTVQVAGGRYGYRQLKLTAGALNANGAVDIGPAGELSGQVTAEVGASGRIAARSSLALAGTVKEPLIRR